MDTGIFSEIINTIIKTLISVSILLILTRIMGKKQISQLTFFDYVVGIIVGSVASSLSVEDNVTYAKGITCMIVLACFTLFLSFISSKSIFIRKLLDGIPIIVIKDGKIVEKNFKKTKLTINDLLEELRLNDVFYIQDVEYGILETNGKISVLLKPEKQTITCKDMNVPVNYEDICTNIIIDGTVLKSNLININKDNTWLINELKKQNVYSPKDVLFATFYNNGLYIDKKNNDPVIKNI